MHIPLAQFGTIHDKLTGTTLHAQALASGVYQGSQALARLGCKPGATAAITHGGTAAFFVDLLSVWTTGAAAACLDPALTATERENVLAFCKPCLVLGDDGIVERKAPNTTSASSTLDDPALILFTSGTTGAPKGVMLSVRAVLARLALNTYEIGPETLRTTLVTLPTHFGHGLIGNALTPLWAGGDIVLVPRGLPLAQTLGALIDEHAITFMSSVPSLWQMALRMSPKPKLDTLKRVHVGSAGSAVGP